jgi:Ca2+-dependent lipid-binding protein
LYSVFRLGNDRYKSKPIYETLNPKWLEQFDLYLHEHDIACQELEVTVWDKDQRSKDDFLGR